MSLAAQMMMPLARRYVAGTTLSEALDAVRELNSKGFCVTLDALGENVKSKKEAQAAESTYERMLEAIYKQKLESHISIKLTMLGLDLGDAVTTTLLKALLRKARQLGIFVRIDMEGSPYTERTLKIFLKLREEFDNVGIVIQAYLYRTHDDAKLLADVGARVRLVKGAYKEPDNIAFAKKEDVNTNYRKILKTLLLGKGHTAIATHDKDIFDYAKQLIKEHKIPSSRYEFQMLYGIARPLQAQLVKEKFTVRIYVPYGENYIPYFYRRIRERKENLFFVLKHMMN